MEVKELKEEQKLDKYRTGYVHTRVMHTPLANAEKMIKSWEEGIETNKKSIADAKNAVEQLVTQAENNLDKMKVDRTKFYESQDKRPVEEIKDEMYEQYLKKREEDLAWLEDFENNKLKQLEEYRKQLEDEVKHIEHQRKERIKQFEDSLEFYKKKAVYRS